MNNQHVISDSLFRHILWELEGGNHWIAYQTKAFYLDHEDMYFFATAEEARQFQSDNISDTDAFAVIHVDSVASLFRQLPYGRLDEFPKGGMGIPQEDTIRPFANLDNDGQPINKNIFLQLKSECMIEKNLDYLKTNVRNHGFGEALGPEIEAQLARGATEFSLQYKTEVNKREIEATLHFGKSDKTELYFFNKYDVRLQNEKNETMAQTFYINNGWGVTLKEAYNLLNGRAIHKELTDKQGQQYQAWVQLDFSAKDKHGNFERKQYHQHYGYDLKEALSYYPVKEMNKPEESQTLIKSLEKGNVQMVTLQLPDKAVKVFIEANPQYKTVTLYDNKMKRLDKEERQEMMKKPDLDASKIKEKTKDLVPEQQEGKKPEKQKGKGKEDGPDNGLVKKNRTRIPGKGMSV